MSLLDEKGRIFGVVNVVDAFVVFLVVAAAGMGVAILFGGNDNGQTTETITVTVRSENVTPFVADAIVEGPVDAEDIVGVENVVTMPATVITQDENGTLHAVKHPRKRTIRVRVTLNVTRDETGYVFDREELEVGRELVFDLGNVSVEGVIEEM